MGTVEPQVASGQIVTNAQSQEMSDGFQLVIDALKLNSLDTIYGLPGIPISDLTRRPQAAGLRAPPSVERRDASTRRAAACALQPNGEDVRPRSPQELSRP